MLFSDTLKYLNIHVIYEKVGGVVRALWFILTKQISHMSASVGIQVLQVLLISIGISEL